MHDQDVKWCARCGIRAVPGDSEVCARCEPHLAEEVEAGLAELELFLQLGS
jgi:hypothetical protein